MVYYPTKCQLTKSQIQKIASAINEKTEITLRLSKCSDTSGGYSLPLTQTQKNKLDEGGVHDLKFSLAQINYISNQIKKHINVKSGGLLPLVALIPIIASILGGAGSIAGAVASTVQKSQANSEMQRHNKELENQLKMGNGLDKIIKQYNKMASKGHSKDEIISNLQQKYGSGVVSDFLAKIPLLGKLLSPLASSIGLGLRTSGKGLYLKAGNGLRL